MITITKERLLTIKQWRETYGPGSNVVLPAEEAEELARIALASLEAEPVSQTYKSQHTQFEQVADLYEMQFDDGRTCAFHTDAQKAAQWLQACDGNRVQEYVKLERLRNALSGNYPVTPDGWISCSERTSGKQVIELTMLVKQLVSQLKKAKPDCKLPDRAMDYLLRNGLISVEGVLR